MPPWLEPAIAEKGHPFRGKARQRGRPLYLARRLLPAESNTAKSPAVGRETVTSGLNGFDCTKSGGEPTDAGTEVNESTDAASPLPGDTGAPGSS